MEQKEHPFGENWEAAKSFVHQLNDSELVQFFYETFGIRETSEANDDFVYQKGHYALSEVSRERDFDKDWGAYEIELIAKHDPAEYSNRLHGDHAIAKAGICSDCKTEYRSYAKRLICPVCKSKGYGT